MNSETKIQYGIGWAESLPSFSDFAGPYDTEQEAADHLEASGFAGVVVSRTVTASDWKPLTEGETK